MAEFNTVSENGIPECYIRGSTHTYNLSRVSNEFAPGRRPSIQVLVVTQEAFGTYPLNQDFIYIALSMETQKFN